MCTVFSFFNYRTNCAKKSCKRQPFLRFIEKQFMRSIVLVAFLLLTQLVFSQLKGNWQGLLIRDGQKIEQASIIYLEFTGAADFCARTREEIPGKDGFVVKKLKGQITGNHAEIKQTVVEKKKDVSGNRWCNMEFVLDYIDSTGYLQGKFTSVECRGVSGKVVLYRTKEAVTVNPTVVALQSWRPIFVDDLKKGRKAPEIRDKERKNFVFQPIYFDFDKTEIKDEYKPYLNNMVKVVLGHSDLRIKVTGHTDAVGSDIYNVDLSQRRAQAIIDYFVSQGLARDRIQIEFKGEKDPIADNETEAGKQLNRRVDFSFI